MSTTESVPAEVIKYFTRKQYFPALAQWSFKLDALYKEFPTLRTLIVEGIDIKDSPSMNHDEIRKKFYAQIGISIEDVADPKDTASEAEVSEVKKILKHDIKKMQLEGLSSHVCFLIKKAVREKKITDPGVLSEISQTHYFNTILKHRFMGFSAEVLIQDAYRHWDWAANIANLCNSLLPVFEKLIKNEVYMFPFLDKDLQETISACNSFMGFLQSQTTMMRSQHLSLDETDPYVGQTVKPASPDTPNGGILALVGTHIMVGDVLIETTAAKLNIIRLVLPPEYDQAWTIMKVYVRPGDVLEAGQKILTISAMDIRAEQGKFFKYFQDVWRQVARIRDKAIMLKEAIEEELRGETTRAGEGETGGFKSKPGRFEELANEPTEEAVEEASEALDMGKKETADMMKKIGRVKRKAQRTG